jgi:hypothetical protein
MQRSIRSLAHSLLRCLAANPLAEVLAKKRGGVRQNPIDDVCAGFANCHSLADLKATMDRMVNPRVPRDCEDPALFKEVCAVLRNKFTTEYNFLILLEEAASRTRYSRSS